MRRDLVKERFHVLWVKYHYNTVHISHHFLSILNIRTADIPMLKLNHLLARFRYKDSLYISLILPRQGIPVHTTDVQFWATAAEKQKKLCFIELELVSIFGELVKYNCVILYKAVLGWQQPQKPHYSVFYRAVWGWQDRLVMNNVFLTGSYSKTYNSTGSAKDTWIISNKIKSREEVNVVFGWHASICIWAGESGWSENILIRVLREWQTTVHEKLQ